MYVRTNAQRTYVSVYAYICPCVFLEDLGLRVHVYTYSCLYVDIYTCVFVRTNVFLYMCICVYMHAHRCIDLYMCFCFGLANIYVHMKIYVYMCVHMYICLHVFTHVLVHAKMHAFFKFCQHLRHDVTINHCGQAGQSIAVGMALATGTFFFRISEPPVVEYVLQNGSCWI